MIILYIIDNENVIILFLIISCRKVPFFTHFPTRNNYLNKSSKVISD
jgi:hypothetical protein